MTEAASKIREAYEALSEYYGKTWIKLADIQELTSQGPAAMTEAITELLGDPSFRAEPEPFTHRVDDRMKRTSVMIGGEPRHLITWL